MSKIQGDITMSKKCKDTTPSEILEKCVILTKYLMDMRSNDSEDIYCDSASSSCGSSCSFCRTSSRSSVRYDRDRREHRKRNGKNDARSRQCHHNEQVRKAACDTVMNVDLAQKTRKMNARNCKDKPRMMREAYLSRNSNKCNSASSGSTSDSSEICHCPSSNTYNEKKDYRKLVVREKCPSTTRVKPHTAKSPELVIFTNEDFQILVRKSEKGTGKRQTATSRKTQTKSLQTDAQRRPVAEKPDKHGCTVQPLSSQRSALRKKNEAQGRRTTVNNISKRVDIDTTPRTTVNNTSKRVDVDTTPRVLQQICKHENPAERSYKYNVSVDTTPRTTVNNTSKRVDIDTTPRVLQQICKHENPAERSYKYKYQPPAPQQMPQRHVKRNELHKCQCPNNVPNERLYAQGTHYLPIPNNPCSIQGQSVQYTGQNVATPCSVQGQSVQYTGQNVATPCSVQGQSVQYTGQNVATPQLVPPPTVPIKIGGYDNVANPDEKFQVKLVLYTGPNGNTKTNDCIKTKPCCPYTPACVKSTEDVCDIDAFLRGEAKKDVSDAEEKDKKDDKDKDKKGSKDKDKKKGSKDKGDKKDKKKEKKSKEKKEKKGKDKKKDKKGEENKDTEKVLSQYRVRTVDEHGHGKEEIIERCSEKVEEKIVFKSIREIAPANMEKLIVIKNKKPRDRDELKTAQINIPWVSQVNQKSVTEKSLVPIIPEDLRNDTPKVNETQSPVINPEVRYSFVRPLPLDEGKTSSPKPSFPQALKPKIKISSVIKHFENKIKRTVSRLYSKGYGVGHTRITQKINNPLQMVKEETCSSPRKIGPKSKSRELMSILLAPMNSENCAHSRLFNADLADRLNNVIEGNQTGIRNNLEDVLEKREESNSKKNHYVKVSHSKVIDLDALIKEMKELKVLLYKRQLEKEKRKSDRAIKESKITEMEPQNEERMLVKRKDNTTRKTQIEQKKKDVMAVVDHNVPTKNIKNGPSRQRRSDPKNVKSASNISTQRGPGFICYEMKDTGEPE